MDARLLIFHVFLCLFGIPSVVGRSANFDENDIQWGTTESYDDANETPETPHICTCPYAKSKCSAEIGTVDHPMPSTCKHADVESGMYIMHKKEPFQVFCNMTNKLTCASTGVPVLVEYFKYGSDPTSQWLSETSQIDMESFYGLTSSQISWLQKRSSSAKQVMRVHYENIGIGFDPTFLYLGNAISLLTWNDVIIKSFATYDTPFFYVLQQDKCNVEDEWCYVDLVLDSNRNKRLPIIDVLIETQTGVFPKLKFENIELCFG